GPGWFREPIWRWRMFKPVAMTRLSLLVLERDERPVLRQLGRAGVIQLTRTVAGPDTAPLGPRDRGVEVARWDRLVLRASSLRQALEVSASLEESIDAPEISVDDAEYEMGRL